MTQIPFDSDTFEVVCRLGMFANDGDDLNTAPDIVTTSGKVTISVLVDGEPVKTISYLEDDGHHRIIQVRGIEYFIDRKTGKLLTGNNQFVSLYKASSPRVKPNNFTYLAVITFPNNFSLSIQFDETPTHADGSVDLGALTVIPATDGTPPITVMQTLLAMQSTVDETNLRLEQLVLSSGRLIKSGLPPTSVDDTDENNIWLNTLTGELYSWNGQSWVVITDPRLQQSIDISNEASEISKLAKLNADSAVVDALGAQSIANAANQIAQTADGRMTVASDNPTVLDASGKSIGSVWDVRSDTTILRRFVLTEDDTWTQVKIGNDFVGENAIGRAQISEASIGTLELADLSVVDAKVGNLTTDKLLAGTSLVRESVVERIIGDAATFGALTANRLLIGSAENIIPNGDVNRGILAPWHSDLVYDSSDKPAGYAASIKCTPGKGNVFGINGLNSWFDVVPNASYHFEIWLKADKPGSVFWLSICNQLGIKAGFMSAESPDGGSSLGSGEYLVNQITVPTVWTRFSGIYTMKSNTSRARLEIGYFNHPSGTETNAVQSIAGLRLRSQMSSVQIGNGIIKGVHADLDSLAASLISSRKLKSVANGWVWGVRQNLTLNARPGGSSNLYTGLQGQPLGHQANTNSVYASATSAGGWLVIIPKTALRAGGGKITVGADVAGTLPMTINLVAWDASNTVVFDGRGTTETRPINGSFGRIIGHFNIPATAVRYEVRIRATVATPDATPHWIHARSVTVEQGPDHTDGSYFDPHIVAAGFRASWLGAPHASVVRLDQQKLVDRVSIDDRGIIIYNPDGGFETARFDGLANAITGGIVFDNGKARIGIDGVSAFKEISADAIHLAGKNLNALIEDRSTLVGRRNRNFDSNWRTDLTRLEEIRITIRPNRQYRVTRNALNGVIHDTLSGSQARMQMELRASTTNTVNTPLTDFPTRNYTTVLVDRNLDVKFCIPGVQWTFDTGPSGELPITSDRLLTIISCVNDTRVGSTALFRAWGNTGIPGELLIEDLGPAITNTGILWQDADQISGAGGTSSTTTTKNIILPAYDAATYWNNTGSWEGQYPQQVIQGTWNGGTENIRKGLWVFSGWPAELSSATINWIKFSAENVHSYYPTVNIELWLHGYTAVPSSGGNMSGKILELQNVGRGRMSVDIPAQHLPGFKNGSYRGVGFFSQNTSLQYYGRWALNAELEINYTI